MKKTNNKGFSLVELIIVIAIMAILVGVLAPQYLKYVEKSRRSADLDTLDSVYTACTTAAGDADVADSPTIDSTQSPMPSSGTSWGKEVLDTLGVSSLSDLKFKSKSAGGAAAHCTVSLTASSQFVVEAGSLKVEAGARSN